ncbi:MAG: Holliday junction resolvase RuvX [candidate division WOR-3 bacterium]
MGRILGIDYGKKWIGIAISDPLKVIANPLKEINLEEKNILEEIDKILKEFEIEKIIIGLPLTMSGKEIEMCEEIKKFKKEIEEKFKIETILWDERFTTKIVKDLKKESHKNAAAVLLQDYLNSLKIKNDNSFTGKCI